MKEQIKSTARRVVFSLLMAAALGGCATYASGPHAQPAYYGAAPVSVGVGLGFYQGDYGYRNNGHRYHGRHHGDRGARHHGLRGHQGRGAHPGRGGHRR